MFYLMHEGQIELGSDAKLISFSSYYNLYLISLSHIGVSKSNLYSMAL